MVQSRRADGLGRGEKRRQDKAWAHNCSLTELDFRGKMAVDHRSSHSSQAVDRPDKALTLWLHGHLAHACRRWPLAFTFLRQWGAALMEGLLLQRGKLNSTPSYTHICSSISDPLNKVSKDEMNDSNAWT
ncbi:hypothetical protein MHYP_G00185560 [Metynnis hypsauchen]